jgi:hypothetical protein
MIMIDNALIFGYVLECALSELFRKQGHDTFAPATASYGNEIRHVNRPSARSRH